MNQPHQGTEVKDECGINGHSGCHVGLSPRAYHDEGGWSQDMQGLGAINAPDGFRDLIHEH